MAKILIALGGNALESGKGSPEEVQHAVKTAVNAIVDLIEKGHDLVITHGNGPQVGKILLQNEIAKDSVIPQSLDICGAMTQGFIGYILQNAFKSELEKRSIEKEVVTIVTQVIVDSNDPAFFDPTKPIGSFYSQEEAGIIMENKGYILKEDSGRGWRRFVPSPKPISIVESSVLKLLSNSGVITIVGGGGGIPITKNGEGVEAVVDKDLTSSIIAAELGVDIFMILTAVDKVSLNFGKANQEDLNNVTIKELDTYIDEGHFAKGSMLPKIEAAASFVKSHPNGKAIITSLQSAGSALKDGVGTVILN